MNESFPRAVRLSGNDHEGGTMSYDHPSRFAGLAGELAGDDDTTPALVLLHGLTYDRRSWDPTLAELRRIDADRRVLTLDLPGHGQSADLRDFDFEHVVGRVHEAVEAAGLRSPVVVGHSAGGLAATIYASTWPISGVVNVDQPLQVGGFAAYLRSKAEQLRGPGYRAVWDEILATLGTEVLPAEAQALLSATSTPTQELLLGYWAEVLHGTPEELGQLVETTLSAVRATRMPYLHLAGQPLDADYERWLAERLPGAVVVCWPGSGHFVHLAHPDGFAELLAGTAAWPLASRIAVG
jgi:pimeloyl-ACP methyl ester carboxylesterase